MILYRANFGDGTWTRGFEDIRDARLRIWERAGIVQYRSSIEQRGEDGRWVVLLPSRAMKKGPAIVEERVK